MEPLPIKSQIEDFQAIEAVFFDFDGVFTDNTVSISETGSESVTCWRSDGVGLERLKSVGVEVAVISAEGNPVVQKRMEKLRTRCMHGVLNKAAAVNLLCEELKLDILQVCFVGNDINDLDALTIVGFPIAVADAYSEAWSVCKYTTSIPGGRGAVREICDTIYYAKKCKASLGSEIGGL